VIKLNISTDIKPISYLKSKTADLLKQINETHRPVIITQNGKPRAVLQDPESFEKMKNAIGILKILSLAEEEIKNNNVMLNDLVIEKIQEKLK